jgi:hypothetical protein
MIMAASRPQPRALPQNVTGSRPGRLPASTQKAAHQPVPTGQRDDRGVRARGWARSCDVRWNSPRSAPVATTGGRWDSRRPAPPICCPANSRPPPRSCSPKPCPAVWKPPRMNPVPTHSGWASCPAPTVTLKPEDCPTAEPGRLRLRSPTGNAGGDITRRRVTSRLSSWCYGRRAEAKYGRTAGRGHTELVNLAARATTNQPTANPHRVGRAAWLCPPRHHE